MGYESKKSILPVKWKSMIVRYALIWDWIIHSLIPSSSDSFDHLLSSIDFPGGSDGKASAYHAGDPGSIPGLGRSSGEGNGNPLQYSCLENPMDRGEW